MSNPETRNSNTKWTREAITVVALQCQTRKEFHKKFGSAYMSAKSIGVFEEVCSHMPLNSSVGKSPPTYKWSKEAVADEAKLYGSRKDFMKGSSGAYDRAIKQRWINEVCAHMPILKRSWTVEAVATEALKYNTRAEFQKKSPAARSAATSLGIYEDVCSHMTIRRTISYSLEEINLAASKYKTRTQFANGEPSMYGKCCSLGILDTVCAHMTYDHYPWKDYELEDLVKKYDTLLEFRTANAGAYTTIFVRGLQRKLLDHFPKVMTTSSPEIAILKMVRETYPTANKHRSWKIKIESRPYIHGFELDILVPELNKAIEFDGTYYHAYKTMRASKSRIKWPDQALREYHEIKDAYFLSKGIKVLHIKEKDWKLDQAACLQRVSEFLCSK